MVNCIQLNVSHIQDPVDSQLHLWSCDVLHVETQTEKHKETRYIAHERPCLTTFPNTEKRVENTMHARVLLTDFEVLNVVKHCLTCLIYLVN